jgi:propanediol dehydratase small subunit
MSLLEALIAQGMKNNEEFTKELIAIKQRVANTPEKQAIQTLQDVTGAMQNVDEFTLQESINTKVDTQAMKDIDDFTLQQVVDINLRLSEVESKLNGGNL